jgi:hypothetical protein
VNAVRWSGITGLTSAFVAGTVWLSAVPSRPPGGDATLRLSWRTPALAIEECRRFSDAELAAMPPHMRRPEVCTGRIAEHELTVLVDDATLVTDTVRPAGARLDRPVYVFRELPLDAEPHRLAVRLTALVPDGYDVGDGRIERRWEGVLSLDEGQVGLVTLDEAGELVVRQ